MELAKDHLTCTDPLGCRLPGGRTHRAGWTLASITFESRSAFPSFRTNSRPRQMTVPAPAVAAFMGLQVRCCGGTQVRRGYRHVKLNGRNRGAKSGVAPVV